MRGKIVDQSGVPFKKSRVELRIYVSSNQQRLVKAVTTDSNGHFDLGEIEAGRYRLLASPNRAFQQPDSIECNEKSLCDIQLVLMVNPTDMAESLCPIK
jgi:5-hydroxyisourate hydrolase-like protein (transthyretin family)